MRRIRAKHTAQSSTAVCSGGTIEEAATGEEKNEAIGEDHVWCCPEMKERKSNVKGDEAIGGAVCFMVTAMQNRGSRKQDGDSRPDTSHEHHHHS